LGGGDFLSVSDFRSTQSFNTVVWLTFSTLKTQMPRLVDTLKPKCQMQEETGGETGSTDSYLMLYFYY